MRRLPVTGYFAEDHPTGYIHKPPTLRDHSAVRPLAQMPDLEAIAPVEIRTDIKRSYKSLIVEMLHAVRNTGDVRSEANLCFVLAPTLEYHGYIKAVRAVKDHPMSIEIVFELTKKGAAFLAEHEAPVHW